MKLHFEQNYKVYLALFKGGGRPLDLVTFATVTAEKK
jgi:hypothetical protein